MSDEFLQMRDQQRVEFEKGCRQEDMMLACFICTFLFLIGLSFYCFPTGRTWLGFLFCGAAGLAVFGVRLILGGTLSCPRCGGSFAGKGLQYKSAFCPMCGVRLRSN